jgi:hypothetical protein
MAWLSNKTPTTSPGATLLKTTAERTVIALAYLLCIFCDYAVEITYKGDDRAIVHELLDAPTPDLFDFFDRVHGMDIVERCDFRTDARRCHTFVFSGEAWFSKDFAQENFYQKPFTETLTFLQSQGYSLSTTPAKGQVVVYCDEQYPNHFGKIDEVDEQGNVIVLSKHGLGNIYRHRVENMIYQFGFQYYCLIPPQV